MSDLTAKHGASECEDPNALIDTGELYRMDKKTTIQNLQPGVNSSKKEVLKLKFFYGEKLSNFTAKPGDPECDGPNALIKLDEPGVKDERTTVWNFEFGTNLIDEGLSDLTEECLAPTHVGSKTQYEQTYSVAKDGRMKLKSGTWILYFR